MAEKPLLPQGADIVSRAAAILARELPAAALLSGAPSAAENEAAPIPAPAMAAAGDLRQRAVDALSELLASVTAGRSTSATAGEGGLPWRRAAGPAAAGGPASLSLSVENQSDGAVRVSFYCTDLLSDGGCSVPSYQVSFDPPNPTLGAHQRAAVTMTVAVPLQTMPGSYSGLVQASGLPSAKAVITLEII